MCTGAVDESPWHAEGVQERLQGALEALRSSKAHVLAHVPAHVPAHVLEMPAIQGKVTTLIWPQKRIFGTHNLKMIFFDL